LLAFLTALTLWLRTEAGIRAAKAAKDSANAAHVAIEDHVKESTASHQEEKVASADAALVTEAILHDVRAVQGKVEDVRETAKEIEAKQG
jgi:hypothetical protein